MLNKLPKEHWITYGKVAKKNKNKKWLWKEWKWFYKIQLQCDEKVKRVLLRGY